MRIRGENPVYKRVNYDVDLTDTATYKGVAIKTSLLIMIASLVAYYVATVWALNIGLPGLIGAMVIAPISAYVMVILAHKQQDLAWMFSILYALLEGMFLGVITLIFYQEVGFDGLTYALLGTFGTVLVMLCVHATGLVKMTVGIKSFLFSSLLSLIFVTILYFILVATGILSGTVAVGLYLAIIVVSVLLSAFFLLYDFDRINSFVKGGASRSSEWSLSLGLMVTIVWIYIDMLRIVYYVFGRD